jgi:hypothetical protein
MISFEKRDQYLLILGEGNRKGTLIVQEGSRKMYEEIVNTNSRLILIDYRNVHFEMGHTDVYNVIRYYESKLPLLTGVVVAAVFNKSNLDLGKTWTDVGAARGFNFRVFHDFEEAEKWLLAQ